MAAYVWGNNYVIYTIFSPYGMRLSMYSSVQLHVPPLISLETLQQFHSAPISRERERQTERDRDRETETDSQTDRQRE